MVALALVGSIAGCGAVNGDGTWGEEDRSLWRIDDGLCPGVGGGCGMEVPVAAGVQIDVAGRTSIVDVDPLGDQRASALEVPTRDLDAAAVAAHQDAVTRKIKTLYSGTDRQDFRA